MKTKLIYGSQLIKTYSCDHERKGVKPFLDLLTNNRIININELVAIFLLVAKVLEVELQLL